MFKIKILLFLSITLLVIGCNAERVSVSSSGLQGTGASFTSSFSGDGRYVVFASSSAFVVEDTNGTSDIYLHDKLNSTTELISFNRTNSSSGNGRSTEPVISADGRYVAFMSFATDLVQGGNGLNYNVYLRDLQTNTTTLVSDINTGSGSVQFHGNSNPSISADGRFIAFTNEGFGSPSAHVYVTDTQTGVITLVSSNRLNTGPANGDSGDASISANGRYIAFYSTGTDISEITTGGGNNTQVFVRDMNTATSELVSRPGPGFNRSPSISSNGRYVVYVSTSTNIVSSVYDINGTDDVYMYDRQSKSYELVSVSQAAIGSLFLAGNNPSFSPAVSADGRFIVFLSSATDLIADPTLASNGFSNVYLRDRFTNTTTLESIGFNTNPAGDISLVAANGNSRDPAISADGEVISYSSNADNLVADDTNGAQDIFTSPIP